MMLRGGKVDEGESGETCSAVRRKLVVTEVTGKAALLIN